MSTISSYTSGIKDLESNGVLERFIHDGNVTTYFVRDTRRCAPFSKLDAEITQFAGSVQYGAVFEAVVPPMGDYLLHLFLEVDLGEVVLDRENQFGENGVLGYVNNLGHNLFKKVSLVINEMEVSSLEPRFLDSELEYMVDGSKYSGYSGMIGNSADLNHPTKCRGKSLKSTSLLIPLPFFFSRDSGVALPVGTMTNSDIRLKFELRKWDELLVLEDKSKVSCSVVSPRESDLATLPSIDKFKIKCDFALVSQKERTRVGCMTRLMLIEQPVNFPLTDITMTEEEPVATITYDSPIGSIKSLYFGIVNTTHNNLHSHYHVGCPSTTGVERVPEGHKGPALAEISLFLDDDERIPNSDYKTFTHLQPFYYATRVPETPTGLHFYSFAIKPSDLDPTGTVNPGATGRKLTFKIKGTPELMAGSASQVHPEKYSFFLTAVCYRLARIENGLFEILRPDGNFRSGE